MWKFVQNKYIDITLKGIMITHVYQHKMENIGEALNHFEIRHY